MGSRTVSEGAIVSNTDRVDPRRSDPRVVSSPITVTASTVGRHGSRSTAASGVVRLLLQAGDTNGRQPSFTTSIYRWEDGAGLNPTRKSERDNHRVRLRYDSCRGHQVDERSDLQKPELTVVVATGNEMEASAGMLFRAGGLVVCVIDNHSDFGEGKTSAGKLLYEAKHSDSGEGDRKAAEELGLQLGVIAARFRESGSRLVKALGMVDAVCAVPFFGNKGLSIPHVLAAQLAEALQVEDLSSHVRKTKATNASKETHALIVDDTQFKADPAVRGRRIALVDDVFRFGSTLASLASVLRRDGALSAEVGLCATKARAARSRDEEY